MSIDKAAFAKEVSAQQRERRAIEDREAKRAIGRRLSSEAARLDLSGTAAAARAGCSRRTWLHYESGATTPDAAMLRRLDALGFDVLYLVTGRGGGKRQHNI
jgi:transcriptional regulator with XRE-family HTH domain